MPESYSDFFCRIAEVKSILPFQARYGADPFSPTLLTIPTGLGKTDTVLLPWLYAQTVGNADAPTRLFIVLPRQNLTRQTAASARRRVERAGLSIRVLELLGGSTANDENLQPDEKVIIVATQDLYFSRALNRGYARRPPRWPIDFALYNQDCLIVLDEIQLMDDALATSAQLAAFRAEFTTYGTASTVWMSATVNPAWLKTVDSPKLPARIALEADDLEQEIVQQRYRASKRLRPAPEQCREPVGCARFVTEQHQSGTRSLVIANTVKRAREIFRAIRQQSGNVKLLHSRFRPPDKRRIADALRPTVSSEGEIVVATQVLEAGVDLTSRLLVTDVAPWGSLVQRFGRVNRYGGDADAEIWWVDQPALSNVKQKNPFPPYETWEVERAVERLRSLTSAAPADLPEEDGPAPWQNVLRRADLLDLFDTTPDLSGNEIDVSRFIRAGDDRDAYLAWREWEGEGAPGDDLVEIADEELCPVPLGELREFMKKKHRVYARNFATERWAEPDSEALFAGMIVVTRCSEGGYTEEEGWAPESKDAVRPLRGKDIPVEGDSSDRKSFTYYRQTLRDHTGRVVEELERVLSAVQIAPEHAADLRVAAVRHDWGKAHPTFQAVMHWKDDSPDLLAKQHKELAKPAARTHFRHELASALAMLAVGESNLAAYLAAAHHGKVRLGLRSMPGEKEADGRRRARGVAEGDLLPRCEVAPGVLAEEVRLSLECMAMGSPGGSWSERTLQLRDEIGPFRLAWLEMLLRAADEQASANPRLMGPELEESTCKQ